MLEDLCFVAPCPGPYVIRLALMLRKAGLHALCFSERLDLKENQEDKKKNATSWETLMVGTYDFSVVKSNLLVSLMKTRQAIMIQNLINQL